MDNLYKESYQLVTVLSEIIEKMPEVKEDDLLKEYKSEQKNGVNIQ